ncbi:putative IQ motif, EF-hand binding protein [Helianthus annuus]|nr:putative IQ motif, EF-hand binding protein [Helianthus annuus]
MGKKGGWLSAVKKAITHSSDSSEKKDKKSGKKSSKKYWFGNRKISRSVDKDLSQTETAVGDFVNLNEAENEQSKHAYSVAYATAVAAEAAVAAAHAAAEVVRLTSTAHSSSKSAEETAAIKIQAAYRGHLARRALRALRGLGRLRSVVQGQSVKRQATSTLKCMQTLARVQSQIRSRRVRMSEENKVVQQLLLKHEKELNNIRSSLGDTWDDSRKSKEETEASLRRKHEAAVRRERTLAYAHTHQQMWKNNTKSPNPTFLDSNNPHWGWNWLERWMAARPWETQSIPDKEPSVGESNKPVTCQSPSTPPTRARSSSSRSRVMPESQKGSVDGDARSFYSVQSDRNKRHSVASSACDDKSVESSPVLPNYMASTESAKARSRMASPIHSPSPLGSGRKGGSEKGSVTGSAKKQLSFTGSPARVSTRFTSH